MMPQNLFDLQTPCFVFDEVELANNFSDFQNALHCAWSKRACVAYSVKTNPLPWILGVSRKQGCLADVVSDEEYDLALFAGYEPRQIIFNGPIKGKRKFFEALWSGSIVNLDSMREVSWLEEYALSADSPRPVSVGVRVNFDLERACPGQTVTGDTGGRFGFCCENGELEDVLARLFVLNPLVVVAGLHMHVTTRSRTAEVYRTLAARAADIVEEFSLTPSFIDIGGGFFGGGAANLGAYQEYARVISDELLRVCDPNQVALYVEPGGAIVCTPGRYVGRVLDAKQTTYDRFVTCDLSRINVDHEMKKTSYAYRLHPMKSSFGDSVLNAEASVDRACLTRQILCGYTCMESDRFCCLENEPALEEGDIIEILNAGAYSMSFTPGFFIQGAPRVYLLDREGNYQLIRPDQKLSALVSGGQL